MVKKCGRESHPQPLTTLVTGVSLIPMTHDEIVNNQAFKVINLLIDHHISEIRWRLGNLKKMIEKPEWDEQIATRVSYEPGGRAGGQIAFGAQLSQLRHAVDLPAEIKFHIDQIAELQRFKLRLLNDYDFTNGDLTTHRQVFGADSTVD